MKIEIGEEAAQEKLEASRVSLLSLKNIYHFHNTKVQDEASNANVKLQQFVQKI